MFKITYEGQNGKFIRKCKTKEDLEYDLMSKAIFGLFDLLSIEKKDSNGKYVTINLPPFEKGAIITTVDWPKDPDRVKEKEW